MEILRHSGTDLKCYRRRPIGGDSARLGDWVGVPIAEMASGTMRTCQRGLGPTTSNRWAPILSDGFAPQGGSCDPNSAGRLREGVTERIEIHYTNLTCIPDGTVFLAMVLLRIGV